MKVYFDLTKKALKSVDLENQTIYTGDLVSTLEVISNQVATNEYVLLSAKLPNAREVGPYLFDGLRVDDSTNNTSTWTFTLSKQNGFTLVAGNTTFYLWLIKGNEKKCIGAVNVNVEHAAATGDYSYFIDIDSSDPEETLNNMAAQIEQCMNAVSLATTAISTLGTTKVDKQSANTKGKVTNTDSATEIERTENNYNSAISLLGDVIKSIVKNPSDASAPNTEIKQEDDQIEIKVVDSNYNNTFTLLLDATSFYVFDNRYSELYPVFQVSAAGIYYMREHLLTSVNTANIVDRAVTGIKLALNSVGTTHIVDGAITNDKLADDAVDTDNVIDKAITRAKLSQDLQDFLNDIVASIPDGSVTTPKIVDGAVTKDKLSQELQDEIAEIEDVIPSDATINNKLVSESTVNDKINSVSAYYITSNAQGDAFATLQALTGASVYYSGGEVRTPTRNDYAIVLSDSTHQNATTRYSYQNGQWQYQYTVNETALTQAQLNALNSGINATKVGNYDNHLSNTSNPHQVTKAQVGLGNVDNTSDANKPISNAQREALELLAPKSTTYNKTEVNGLLDAKEDKANKTTEINSGSTNDKYPSAKAVYDGIVNYGGAVGVNKALYHLGAFDSADGKTRHTGYVGAKELEKLERNEYWAQYGYYLFVINADIENTPNNVLARIVANKGVLTTYATFTTTTTLPTDDLYYAGVVDSNENGFIGFKKNGITTLAEMKALLNDFYCEYARATSYPDTPIENQSILPLDTNMANKIRQEIVDGLNLFDTSNIVKTGGYWSSSGSWNSVSGMNIYGIYLKAGSYVISYTSSATFGVYTLNNNGEWVATIYGMDSTPNPKTLTLANDSYIGFAVFVSQISIYMLNEGTHPYPHSEYRGKILHEVDRPKLYKHFVKLSFGDDDYAYIGEVICSKATALTYDDLKALYPNDQKQLQLYPANPSIEDCIGNTPSYSNNYGAKITSAYFYYLSGEANPNQVWACVMYVGANGKLVAEERSYYVNMTGSVLTWKVTITDNVEEM